jgi:peptide/nickel transport system permease protein
MQMGQNREILRAFAKEIFIKFPLAFLVSSFALYTIVYFSPGGDTTAETYSWPIKYGGWIYNVAIHQDLGKSLWGEKLSSVVWSGFKKSLKLISLSLIFSSFFTAIFLFSFKIGRSRLTNGLRYIFYATSAIPVLFVGYTFVFKNPTLRAPAETDLGIHYYILPALILGIGDGFLSEMIRHSEQEVENIREQGYLRMAKALGAKIWRHAWRDYAIHTMQILRLHIIYLLSGAVLVEKVFNIKGLGNLALDAASARDYQKILALSMFILLSVYAMNCIVTMLAYSFDPRLRRNY